MFTHTKRYMVISGTWNFDHEKNGKSNYAMQPTKSWDEFDTLEEANDWISMIKDQYSNIPIPNKIENTKRGYVNLPDGSFCWGYVLLDFDLIQVLDVAEQGICEYKKSDLMKHGEKRWKFYDTYFRKPNEIPNDYKWDDGEYLGWLQFRWGDGKNAIGTPDYKANKTIPSKYEMFIWNHNINPVKHNKQDRKKKSFYKPYNDSDKEQSDYDMMQNDFDDKLDQEKQKYMMDKYGW